VYQRLLAAVSSRLTGIRALFAAGCVRRASDSSDRRKVIFRYADPGMAVAATTGGHGVIAARTRLRQEM
jgi:hypothetical protein